MISIPLPLTLSPVLDLHFVPFLLLSLSVLISYFFLSLGLFITLIIPTKGSTYFGYRFKSGFVDRLASFLYLDDVAVIITTVAAEE